MKLLKTISITFLLFCFTINIQAQEKKSNAQKRAVENSEFITSKMDLSAEQATFLQNVLLEKYESNSKKIKGQNLSQEEKKAIYKQSHKDTNAKLSEKFSKEEINQINELVKAKNKESKK